MLLGMTIENKMLDIDQRKYIDILTETAGDIDQQKNELNVETGEYAWNLSKPFADARKISTHGYVWKWGIPPIINDSHLKTG